MDIQIHKAKRMPYYLNVKRPSPRCMTVKLSKINEKEIILHKTRGKESDLQRDPIKLLIDFSTETLWGKRGWNDMFTVLRNKNCQPRILYATKLPYRYQGDVKPFPDKS